MRAACLGHKELALRPWRLKSDNSLSLRGNVERYHDRPFLCPDCFLFAVGCFV